jgi:hypothetical protein
MTLGSDAPRPPRRPQRATFYPDTDPSRGRFPSRGVAWSAVVHAFFALFVILYNQFHPPRLVRFEPKRFEVEFTEAENAVTLPSFGRQLAGSPGQSAGPRSDGSKTVRRASGSPAQVTYKGPQLIVSDPPNPDNFNQTVRRPDLVQPRILKEQVRLPNLVMLSSHARVETAKPQLQTPPAPAAANAQARLPVPKGATEVPLPALKLPAPEVAVEARLTVPVSGEAEGGARIPPPEPAAGTSPKTAPESDSIAPPSDTKEKAPPAELVVVSALPMSGRLQDLIPEGERHGKFTVAPAPSEGTSPGLPAPGKTAGGSGTHDSGSAGAGDAQKGSGAGSGAGTGSGRGGSGSGTGASGSGGGGNTGEGRGAGGNTPGGAGAGPGSDSLIIHGGPGGAGPGGSGATPSGPRMRKPRGPRPAYDVTIVGTGSSSGMPDYGVFRGENVFTVYLSMADADQPGADWILQYSPLSPAGATGPDKDPAAFGDELLAPVPIEKHALRAPPEQSAKFAGRKIVIRGIINEQGKVEDLRILRNPFLDLSAAFLQTLALWEFEPAELAGRALKVKVVFTIPIE